MPSLLDRKIWLVMPGPGHDRPCDARHFIRQKVSSFADAKAAIAAGKDIDFEGASGPLTLDKSGTPAGSYAIMKAADGAWAKEKFYPVSAFE